MIPSWNWSDIDSNWHGPSHYLLIFINNLKTKEIHNQSLRDITISFSDLDTKMQ